ncbi:hypothetical protein AMECASPLE_026448 [Ameca splendens]|uniref:Uncharacterized protein n=1 Tax=Ameca splendens TaxID=208324 RepID=A0ABV0XHV1_9TELE
MSPHGLEKDSGPQHCTSSCVHVQVATEATEIATTCCCRTVGPGQPNGQPLTATEISCMLVPFNAHTWMTGTASLLSTRRPGNLVFRTVHIRGCIWAEKIS